MVNFANAQSRGKFYPNLVRFLKETKAADQPLSLDRVERLNELALFVEERRLRNEPIKIVFTCDSNARTSLMAEIWANAAAYYFQVEDVEFYSGGLSPGQVSHKALKSMERAGFIFYEFESVLGTRYQVNYGYDAEPLEIYAKKYSAKGNPTRGYCAALTCASMIHLDPALKGVLVKIALPYEDLAFIEGTEEVDQAYDQLNASMAREMFHFMQKIRK